jgi:hypothetical protein
MMHEQRWEKVCGDRLRWLCPGISHLPYLSTLREMDARPYPLSTVGMALHMAATKVIRIASVADKPVTKTELAVDQPATVTRSENQYQVKAQPD